MEKFKPLRTCVICREKKQKDELLRFVVIDKTIVFDINAKLQSRGIYVCDNNKCMNNLDKWKNKKIKNRRIKLFINEAS